MGIGPRRPTGCRSDTDESCLPWRLGAHGTRHRARVRHRGARVLRGTGINRRRTGCAGVVACEDAEEDCVAAPVPSQPGLFTLSPNRLQTVGRPRLQPRFRAIHRPVEPWRREASRVGAMHPTPTTRFRRGARTPLTMQLLQPRFRAIPRTSFPDSKARPTASRKPQDAGRRHVTHRGLPLQLHGKANAGGEVWADVGALGEFVLEEIAVLADVHLQEPRT